MQQGSCILQRQIQTRSPHEEVGYTPLPSQIIRLVHVFSPMPPQPPPPPPSATLLQRHAPTCPQQIRPKSQPKVGRQTHWNVVRTATAGWAIFTKGWTRMCAYLGILPLVRHV